MKENRIPDIYVNGLKFDIENRKLSLFKYKKEYSFADIIDFSFVDNSYIKRLSEASAQTKTDTGNALGRALVGGFLFGGLGAVVGGMTASTKTTYNPGTELKVEQYTIQIIVNDFDNPLLCLDFGNDFASANLVAAYLKIIVFRNSPQNSRYNIFKKLHDLKTYYTEGLMTEDEYNREVNLIKSRESNAIQEDTQRIRLEIEEKNKKFEEEREKIEEELKRKDAISKLLKEKQLEKAKIEKLISDKEKLYGFKVGDAIILNESGEASFIIGFTTDNKMVCEVENEYQILDFGEFKLV